MLEIPKFPCLILAIMSFSFATGHLERMEGLTMRTNALRLEGGRLRWEDCVKRDLAGVGERRIAGVETAVEQD